MCMSGGPRRTSHTRTQRVSSKPHLVTGTVTVTFTHEPMRTVLPTTKKIHHDHQLCRAHQELVVGVLVVENHRAHNVHNTQGRARRLGSKSRDRRLQSDLGVRRTPRIPLAVVSEDNLQPLLIRQVIMNRIQDREYQLLQGETVAQEMRRQ